MNNLKSYSTVAVIALIIGVVGGSQMFPKIKEKTVEKQVDVIQKDVQTTIKEIIKPDGTKEIITTIDDKSKQKKENTQVKTISKPDWMVGLGMGINSDKSSFYSAHVQRRVLGDIFLGATATTKKDLGVTVSYEF